MISFTRDIIHINVFYILVKKHDDNTNILNSIMRKRCNFALSNKDNTNSMNEKYQFLTHAPVHRVIATMAFPTIGGRRDDGKYGAILHIGVFRRDNAGWLAFP